MLNFGLLGGGSGFNPLTDYTWSTVGGLTTEADGTRMLVDEKNGNDIESTTGQGLYMDGAQSVPTTISGDVQTICYMKDGVLIYDETAQTLNNYELNSALEVGIFSNYILYDGVFTIEEKEYLRTNPESFLFTHNGEVLSGILPKTKTDKILAYLPLVETVDDVIDYVAYGNGANLNTGDVLLTTADEIAILTVTSNSVLNLNVTDAGTNQTRPSVSIYDENIVDYIDGLYYLEFDYVVHSGVVILKQVSFGVGDEGTAQVNITLQGSGTYKHSHTCTNSTSGRTLLYFDGRNTFDVDILNLSVSRLEGVYEVSNFIAACRTNAKGLSTSIQTISWEIEDTIQVSSAFATPIVANMPTIGQRPTVATEIGLATKFASPTGLGDGTIENPYDIITAFDSLVAGDVLFLRGGTYDIPETALRVTRKVGTETQPIIIESYPGELAVLDGKNRVPQDIIDDTYPTDYGVYLRETEYIYLRKVEITGMSRDGITLIGKHNRVIGCHIHTNFVSGVFVMNRDDYQVPYLDGWNIIQDNLIHDNSDADIPSDGTHNDGDNADGVAIPQGQSNIVDHNTIYSNADDGIDTWRSNDTLVTYNIVYDNGRGTNGNGNGIKMGGNGDIEDPYYGLNGLRTIAHHNVSFSNKAIGFDKNSGINTQCYSNTSYDNNMGYSFDSDDVVYDNISTDDISIGWYTHDNNNSWNIGEDSFAMYSYDVNSEYLLLSVDSKYHAIGALEGTTVNAANSMFFISEQADQVIQAVPVAPWSLVEYTDTTINVYTSDGVTFLKYEDGIQSATTEIVGNITMDYVSQITGGNVDERTRYSLYDVVLTQEDVNDIVASMI